jgi:hypothetical protein
MEIFAMFNTLAVAAKPGSLNDQEKISEHGYINAAVAYFLF